MTRLFFLLCVFFMSCKLILVGFSASFTPFRIKCSTSVRQRLSHACLNLQGFCPPVAFQSDLCTELQKITPFQKKLASPKTTEVLWPVCVHFDKSPWIFSDSVSACFCQFLSSAFIMTSINYIVPSIIKEASA